MQNVSQFIYNSLAFAFRYVARDRAFVPVTQVLTAFEPTSDTATAWRKSGYAYNENDRCDAVTNSFHGALSHTHVAAILLCEIVPEPIVRVFDRSTVGVGVPTPTFPRGGGIVIPLNHATAPIHGAFFGAIMHGGIAQLRSSFMLHQDGQPHEPMTMRFAIDGAASWRPNDFVFTSPETGSHRNSITFEFRNNVSSVGLPDDAEPFTHDGEFVVLDMDVRVFSARVIFSRDHKEVDGATEFDRDRIEAWRKELVENRSPIGCATNASASRDAIRGAIESLTTQILRANSKTLYTHR